MDRIYKFLKLTILHTVAISLAIFTIVTFALNWPSIAPSGETSGGKFMGYFAKIFTPCPANTVLKGYDINKNPICSGIGSNEIINNSITADDLGPNSVGTSEITTNAVGSSEIINNSVTAFDLATNSVGSSEISTNAVGSSEVINGSLTLSDINSSSLDSRYLNRFGGMYQIYACDGSCRKSNPITGSCSCPSGYSRGAVNDFNSPVGAPCGSQDHYEGKGMVMFMCYR